MARRYQKSNPQTQETSEENSSDWDVFEGWRTDNVSINELRIRSMRHWDASAQFYEGDRYAKGIQKSYQQAANWYRRAADQGHREAQTSLGNLYASGKGVPQDFIEAHKWYNLAAASGHNGARKKRDNLASQMTIAQIAEAQP